MRYIFFISLLLIQFLKAQIITAPENYRVCDEDGDGYVSIPFSDLQSYALDYLEAFNHRPEIYVTQAYGGIAKITNLYNNPQVQTVCPSDGNGGYYDIAINRQQEIFIVRQNGILQKIDPLNCQTTNIGQVHSSGQSVLALSFDKLNHLYEGGWTSQVYRAEAQNLNEFHLWHDFGIGRAAGDFVQIGDFLYVAWTVNGRDYLYKVTLGDNNQYISHESLGPIEYGTFGLASEYGRLYGNTVDYLYEINLETMERTILRQRPNQGNSSNDWWGAAGLHEALEMKITYHAELNQALDGSFPLTDPISNTTPFFDVIYIRIHEVTNNDIYIIPINIIVEVAPQANDASLRSCKDPVSGLASFNLDDAQTQINPTVGINFAYFATMEDLVNDQNPLPLIYSVNSTTYIYARVKSDSQSTCSAIAELELIVPSADGLDYDSEVVFCWGTEAVLSVPDEFVSYQWNGLQGEDLNQPLNHNEVVISYPGSYSVTVTDNLNCTYSIPFEASLDGSPEITDVIINGTSITIKVSPEGVYEYSLNGIFWQNSDTFHNIEIADYDIYVRDYTGCLSEKYEFSYFLVPNFISPNGDGYNDIWKIRGIGKHIGAEVKIFDRYGKLFFDKKVESENFFWDGKYMGRPLPTGSYWYIILLPNGKKVSGSILLKN